MGRFLSFICVLVFPAIVFAQSVVSGKFDAFPSTRVSLSYAQGKETKEIGKTVTDKEGMFAIHVPFKDSMPLLLKVDSSKFAIALLYTGKSIEMKNATTNLLLDSLTFTSSPDNALLNKYMLRKVANTNKLGYIKYGAQAYATENTKKEGANFYKALQVELKRLQEDSTQTETLLSDESYVKRYVRTRLVADKLMSLYQNQGGIDDAIQAKQGVFGADWEMVYKSGLWESFFGTYATVNARFFAPDKKAYEQTWMSDIDAIIPRMNLSTEYGNAFVFELLDIFEREGLEMASEALIARTLGMDLCSDKTKNVASRILTFRRMLVGNIAPNISFKEKLNGAASLADMNAKYYLLCFWESSCSHCQEEMPLLKKHYENLKNQSTTIITIAADTEEKAYKEAIKGYPWNTYCDYAGINGPAFTQYGVYATPTIYVLNKDLRILGKYGKIEEAIDKIRELTENTK